jgi:hypothetical protein
MKKLTAKTRHKIIKRIIQLPNSGIDFSSENDFSNTIINGSIKIANNQFLYSDFMYSMNFNSEYGFQRLTNDFMSD